MPQNDDKMVWGTWGRGEGQGKDDFRAKVAEWLGEVRNGTKGGKWQKVTWGGGGYVREGGGGAGQRRL